MLTLGVCYQSPVAAASPNIVSILAPDEVTGIGQEFTANVVVEPQMALSGVQFSLAFNPVLVNVDSINEGTLLSQNGGATYFNPGAVDNQAGTITGVAGVIISPGQSVSSSGTLASIELRTLAGGSCPLTLSTVIIGDTQGQSLPVSMVNDEVIINANHHPVLSPIGNKSVSQGNLLSFTISATDADGDSLSFLASNLPEGASFNPITQAFSFSPAASGIYSNIHFEVTDGELADSEDITVTVNTSSPVIVGGGGGGGGGLLPIQYTNPNGSIVSGAINMLGEVRGTIKTISTDGTASLTIPSGTYAKSKSGAPLDHLSITISENPPLPPAGLQIISLGYDFGPDGATFDPSVELSVSYDPANIPEGTNQEDLVLAYYDEEAGNWILPPFTLDVENSIITVEIAHFTSFFILAATPLPEFSFSTLSVHPEETEANEEVNISLLVTNTGTAAGDCPVRLLIADEVVASRHVSIAAGATEKVAFSISKENAGIYAVDLNGLTGSFTVKQPPLPPPMPEIAAFSIIPSYTETNRITSVRITYTLNDLPRSPADVALILKVSLDGKPLEEFELLSGEQLKSSRVESSMEYAPTQTWQKGTYSFRAELWVDGKTPAASTTESLELTEQMLIPVIAWAVLGKIIGAAFVALVITLSVILLVRRKLLEGLR